MTQFRAEFKVGFDTIGTVTVKATVTPRGADNSPQVDIITIPRVRGSEYKAIEADVLRDFREWQRNRASNAVELESPHPAS